jgi:hypothetical protein
VRVLFFLPVNFCFIRSLQSNIFFFSFWVHHHMFSFLSLVHIDIHKFNQNTNFMAHSTLHSFTFPSSLPFLFQHLQHKPYFLSPKLTPLSPTTLNPLVLRNRFHNNMHSSRVSSFQDAIGGAMTIVQSSPATWQSSLLSNLLIFLLGSPILVTGLSFSGIVAAFLLGTLTWRAFGSSGFLLVATYFIIVS